jgi:acetyl-CoA acetyltransferase
MSEGSWLRDRTAIVGIGHTAYGRRGEFVERGKLHLVVEAVTAACEDAGIKPSDIDGYTSYSNDETDGGALAGVFGAERLRFTAMGWGGGGGAMGGAYLYAAMAVATGQANYVAVTRGIVQSPDNRFGAGFARTAAAEEAAGKLPNYGIQSPGQAFALAARRHMHRFGTTIDHFGEVAINARLMAANNPYARFRTPITMDDHHNSRMLADPLRLLDYCMESDSGTCVIVTTKERARDLRQEPVSLAGMAMGAPHRWGGGHFSGVLGAGNQMSDDDFASAGQRTVAEDLYRNAGLVPTDVDVALMYDHFTPMVLMGLEDFQLVPKGESGPFVAEGNIRAGGSLPVNTHGGNLAEVYAHGMTHVIEGVRQLRGQSPNQVSGADVALVVAGSSPAPTSALLLTKES